MRNKLVHQQGLVAKAQFEASSDKYTGIFQGADNVIIRLSDADLIVPDVSSNPNPSIALKFLRDGVSSANQFGMVSFEGSDSWDFFGQDFLTHLPEHTGDCGPRSIARLFGEAFLQIFTTGSLDMGKYDQAGAEVDAYFPYFIRFKPVRTTTTDDDGNTTTVPPITNADSPFF